MKYKALFLDFYGTLVHEDGAAIAEITKIISASTPANNTPKEIGTHWWNEFRRLFENSYGSNFKTQRELEHISIHKMLEHFQCKEIDLNIDKALFTHWMKPPIFKDTLPFLAQNILPVCIVSNIDTSDILTAIEFHSLNFKNVVTSEDAKSYKPRSEIFEMALGKMNLLPHEVLHVGDSLTADIVGAHNCGIHSFWLNRKSRQVPHNCVATYRGNSLLDILKHCT